MQRSDVKLAQFGEEAWSEDYSVNKVQTLAFSGAFVIENKQISLFFILQFDFPWEDL